MLIGKREENFKIMKRDRDREIGMIVFGDRQRPNVFINRLGIDCNDCVSWCERKRKLGKDHETNPLFILFWTKQ